MTDSGCPSIERWESVAQSTCNAEEARVLLSHAVECGACADLLDSVRRNLDLAGAVKAAMSEKSSGRRQSPLGLVGRQFDGFMIQRVLGSGASSTVYEARQERTGRRAAIKLLSTFAVSPEHLRRFEHEAKILARLRHPGIAQVFACGTLTDDAGARPYIAMELIDGVPVSQHATQQQLSRNARIELLAQACEAIEYAHSSGVVHRDLKPANLLVASDGTLRVVDFGVARLTGSQSMLSTMHTAQGQIVGTVAYMSPEHVLGAQLVDARSDVYSLGVIGYELLTGKPPYAISDSSLEAALRTITQAEPYPPSRLNVKLGGDVETILLRTLGKRPQDRYASAGALATDLRRVLAGESIFARRPGAAERVEKFCRQHKALVAGSAAVLVALLIGLAGTTYGMVRAVQREKLAEERRKNAEELATLLEQMLREAHPHEAKGRGYTVRQMLDSFSRRFGNELADQPMVEASLRTTMGTGYRVLGEYVLARPHLERALELRRAMQPSSPTHVASALCDLAMLEHDEARYPKAIELFQEATELPEQGGEARARALLGWSDCMRHTGDLKTALTRGTEALDAAVKLDAAGAARSPRVAEAQISLSRVERELGNYDAAKKYYEDALSGFKAALGADDPRIADAMNDGAWLAFMRRDHEAAERMGFEALRVGEKTLGSVHPDVGNSKYELGLILASRNKPEEGAEMLREAVAIYVNAHGEYHPSTFTAKEALARVLRVLDRNDEALSLLKEVLEGRRKFFGERNIEVAYALSALGQVERALKHFDESVEAYQSAIEIYRATYGGPHQFIAHDLEALAGIAKDRNDLEKAEKLYREAVEGYEASIGPAHADTLYAILSLGLCLENRGLMAEAMPLYDVVLQRTGSAPMGWRVALAHQGRGRCLLAQGKAVDAVGEIEQAVKMLEETAGTTTSTTNRVKKAKDDLEKAKIAAAQGVSK